MCRRLWIVLAYTFFLQNAVSCFCLLTGVKYDLALLKRFSGYLNKRSSHTASSRIFRRMLDHALPVCPLTSPLQLHYCKNGNHCLGQRVEFPSPARRLGLPYWFIAERWLLNVGSCFLLYLGQWSDSLASFFFLWTNGEGYEIRWCDKK